MLASALVFVAAALAARAAPVTPQPARLMAITIDDLPGNVGPPGKVTVADLREVNRRMLQALRAVNAPAVAFVNERKLQVTGERDARAAILIDWLDAGMELGNHTFEHKSLSKTPLGEYQDDVLRGEVVTRALLAERKQPLTWFRHPYTHTGPTAEIKQGFERFLGEHGYKVAPFTIENADYAWAALYEQARGATGELEPLRRAYVDHLEVMCAFYETLTRDTFGRDIPQILLAHVNRLNADVFPQLLARLSARGYRFIPLVEALRDDAYRTTDGYIGKSGPSWLHRFRIARGKPDRLRDEPDLPKPYAAQYRALRANKP